jgi:PIN domain nuclease of toxin-antitoxin system
MRYLIDTNIFLFAMQERDKLSKDVLDIITDYENRIYIKKEHILELGKIEPIPNHKDPFDHAIMAHAITNSCKYPNFLAKCCPLFNGAYLAFASSGHSDTFGLIWYLI